MPKLQVEVDTAALRRFRRQAIRHFPREILAYLAGEVEGQKVRITVISTPPIVGTRNQVGIEDDDWKALRKAAKDTGVRIVGSIHTHTIYPDFAEGPSTQDIHSAATEGEKVYAICSVRKPKDGGRASTTVLWFGGGPQVEVRGI